MDNNYYVSSIAFLGNPIGEMVRICEENHLNLEFSSGIPFMDNMEEIYNRAILKKMPHNYFPAPKTPFVLNLASNNKKIREKSIEHCKNGLSLAKNSNAPFFAAHAGFCIDPNPEDLGKKISYSENFDENLHKELFIKSIIDIIKFAERFKIDFLIENNVLAPYNYDGVNPFFCCDSLGINEIFESINHPRLGLLLDTAHLKVSCNTLQLDLHSELIKIEGVIKGIHHSDNNGEVDDNSPLDGEYWFLKYMRKFKSLVHVLEVKNQLVEEIKKQISILNNYGS